VLGLTRGRVRVEGLDRLPARDPVLFALNHVNTFEAIVVPILLIGLRGERKIAFLADWMYFHLPVFGWALRTSGAIPVWTKRARIPGFDRLRPKRRTPPLEAAAAAVGRGRAVALYLEGRRNPDPRALLPGRPGLARLALATGVPVVPVGVDYVGRSAGRRPSAIPRLIVRIGAPLEVPVAGAELAADFALRRRREAQLTDRVMQALADLSGKQLPVVVLPKERSMDSCERTSRIIASRVASGADLEDAKRVVDEVYVQEKGWMSNAQLDSFPGGESISWFLVRVHGEPAGLLRVVYDPPLQFPPEYRVELAKGVDWAALAAVARVAEVGRFMIRAQFRRNSRIAVELMRVAVREIVERDYSHLITDVFEGDPHSPYDFHTKILGFEEIGSHSHGEMHTDRRRIILALDINQAYLRMRAKGGRFYRSFTEGYRHLLDARVATPPAQQFAAAR
jgi:1-acyl-sn-glycerol-3-phosphate acyltransferase